MLTEDELVKAFDAAKARLKRASEDLSLNELDGLATWLDNVKTYPGNVTMPVIARYDRDQDHSAINPQTSAPNTDLNSDEAKYAISQTRQRATHLIGLARHTATKDGRLGRYYWTGYEDGVAALLSSLDNIELEIARNF